MARTQISHIVAEVNGDTVPNANVLVLHRDTGEAANVTVNENGTGGNINPATTDSAGRIPGWVEEGSYTLVISAASFATYSRAYEALFGASVGNVGEGAVTTAKILDNVLTTAHIADNAVITVKIGANQVTEPKLGNDAISTRIFVAKSVGTSELAPDAVDANKLQTDSVGQAQIASGAVTAAELANGAVTSAKLAPSSVATADVADLTVTAPKISANQITSVKVADDSVGWDAIHNDFMPIGSIITMPKPFSDPHWLPLDGTMPTVSRVTYAALFNRISTIYGSGDGSTTFGLPDLRGRMLYGLGTHPWVDTMGENDGLADVARRSPFHSHTTGNLTLTDGWHNHGYWQPNQGGCGAIETFRGGDWYFYPGNCIFSVTTTGHAHSASGSTGWGSNLTNAPGFQTVYFYIRAL